MKIKIDLPEIKGYEYTGEFRQPRKGEYGIDLRTNIIEQTNNDYVIFKSKGDGTEIVCPILRKKKKMVKVIVDKSCGEMFDKINCDFENYMDYKKCLGSEKVKSFKEVYGYKIELIPTLERKFVVTLEKYKGTK